MSISQISSQSALQVQNLVAMRRQLDDLQRQLGTGRRANDYAGIGLDRGLTVGLRTQLAATESFSASISLLGTRLQLGQTALTDMAAAADVVKTALPKSAYELDQTGRTSDQNTARGQLDRILAALSTQFGDQYIFSGQSSDIPPVESLDHILDGIGTRAGFHQVMNERNQADLGANGLGRLVFSSAPSNAGLLVGTTAAVPPDAPAVVTGTVDLTTRPANAVAGTLTLNGLAIAVSATDDGATIAANINTAMAGSPATPQVTASVDAGGHLVLASAGTDTAIDATGSTGALLSDLGLPTGITNWTNLLTNPHGVTSGQTLTIAVGTNPPLTITFGIGIGKVSTLAQLNTALGTLTGGTAAVNPANGNLTVTATNATDAISIGGTVPPPVFGLAPATLSVAEDVDGSPFGLKLFSLTTTIAGAMVSAPGGVPNTMSVDFTAATPADGDTVTYSFKLPDNTTEAVVLTAAMTAKSLQGAGGFAAAGGTVGGTPAAITIQAPGLNNGIAVSIPAIAATDDATIVANRIGAALNALSGGNDGISVSVVSGQLVINSAGGDVVTLAGDSATLDAIGFSAGNRVSTIVSASTGDNQFALGGTQAQTLANLQTALSAALGKLARTSLSAASAIAAANDFFTIDAAHPPQRVNGPPFDTATSLIAGTSTDTVTWYVGEAGALPARVTATSRIDASISISYGMRANEQGLRIPVANLAVFAAMNFTTTDPDGKARYTALTQRLRANLANQQGVQKISDIEAELAGAQTAMAAATERHIQTTSALTDLLQNVEGVPMEEVGAQILAVQTSLQGSLQTAALLAKLSLVNYL